MTQLSAIIITKNEAHNIRRCLESIKWADEIIVVDSGSQDDTLAICREYTDKIIVTDDWPGFGPQKQRALDQANGEWVLSIDADEEVSAELRKEIIHATLQTHYSGFTLSRPVIFYDQIIKHALGSNRTLRLLQRKCGRFSEDKIHETILVDGKIGHLTQPLYHYSFRCVDDILTKMNRYSSLSAKQKHQRSKRSSSLKAIVSALWMFIRVYFIKLGFLDGRAGLLLAVSFAEGAFYRYMKLLYLNDSPASERDHFPF